MARRRRRFNHPRAAKRARCAMNRDAFAFSIVQSLKPRRTREWGRDESPCGLRARKLAFIERFMSLPISEEAAAVQAGIPLAPLAGVLDSIGQGIVLLASDSYPCFTNSAAERMLVADPERGVIAREMRSVTRAALMHHG